MTRWPARTPRRPETDQERQARLDLMFAGCRETSFEEFQAAQDNERAASQTAQSLYDPPQPKKSHPEHESGCECGNYHGPASSCYL